MEVIDRFMLDQKMESLKKVPFKRQILRLILKYELQSLIQRLAEIGEESVVLTANIVDGTHSVLSSDQGEKFIHDEVVSHFMDHFVRFLFTGEIQYLPKEVHGAFETCKLQQRTCVQESNHSVLSANSDEPETYMHMKKHQIEQFNRQKDSEDKTIDETVSLLVKNILREGKEKEKKSVGTVLSGTNRPSTRRKRSFNLHDSLRKRISEGCSQAKRMPIADFFPTLSPVHGRSGGDEGMISPNFTGHENDTNILDGNGSEVITIKVEPEDIGEYGGSQENDIDNSSIGELSQDREFVMNVDSHCSDLNKTSKPCDSSFVNLVGAEEEIIIQRNGYHDENVENSIKQNVSSCDVIDEIKKSGDIEIRTEKSEDEDISLPMVEEFYQNRDNSVEDLKLNSSEVGTKTSRSRKETYKSCYKQSRKKSNTFNLVLNGYLYIKDKQSSTGTVYWKCGRSGCKGRVIQRGQELITSQVHIHEPSD